MGVSEMHGVWASGKDDLNRKWVEICEVGSDRVQISYEGSYHPLMTADQARYLGRKLIRLAGRIDQRKA